MQTRLFSSARISFGFNFFSMPTSPCVQNINYVGSIAIIGDDCSTSTISVVMASPYAMTDKEIAGQARNGGDKEDYNAISTNFLKSLTKAQPF